MVLLFEIPTHSFGPCNKTIFRVWFRPFLVLFPLGTLKVPFFYSIIWRSFRNTLGCRYSEKFNQPKNSAGPNSGTPGTSNFPESGTQKGVREFLVPKRHPAATLFFLRLLVPLMGSPTGSATFLHCRNR